MTHTELNEIIATILNQLGGRKFTAMTGAKNYTQTDRGVTFKIGRNAGKVNQVTVDYNIGKDLYDLKFEKVSISKKTFEIKRKLIKSFDGVFGSQLQELFTSVTGMETKLF